MNRIGLLGLAALTAGSLAWAQTQDDTDAGPAPDGKRMHRPFDTDGDGQISRDEMIASFDKLDADGDGVLSRDEMPGRGRHGRHGHHKSPGGLLIRLADADADRTVTAAEWQTFLASVTASSGEVSKEALASALASLKGPGRGFGGPMREGKGDWMLDRLVQMHDANEDGLLQASELDTVFTRHDADGNGALEGDELGPQRKGGGKRGRR